MKNNIKFIMVVLLVLPTLVFAHRQHVHQYIVRESYTLLSLTVGSIPEMANHVGDADIGDFPWSTGKIVAGAWREDVEDPVWGYADICPGCPGYDRAIISITHFWDADQGDEVDNEFEYCYPNNQPPCTYGTIGPYPNAWKKLLRYYKPGQYGNWTAKVPWPAGRATFTLTRGGEVTITQNGQIGFDYDNLVQFYKDRVIRITGYLNVLAQWVTSDMDPTLPHEVYVGTTTRDLICWEVLGRMAHLLGDMSIPAHAHRDEHGLSPTDSYEDWYGTQYEVWSATTVYNTFGGAINPYQTSGDPLHYLMYTTQQISDHFGSNGPYEGDGNDIIGGNPTPEEIAFLNSINLASLGEPTGVNGPFGETEKANIRDKTLPYVIRTTAGLLYWFAIEACLIPSAPLTPTLSSPANNSTCKLTTITLEWNEPKYCPTSYRLQVSTSNTFSITVYDNSSITSTSQTVSGLAYGTTYYWRVRASNGAGTSGWSSVRSFTTVAYPSIQSFYTNANYVYRGETATLTCNSTPAGCNIFDWTWTSNQLPSGATLTPTGNTATLRNDNVALNTTIYPVIRVFNAAGGPAQSGLCCPDYIILKNENRPPPPPPSCPFVFTWDGVQFREDNNILPQSVYSGNQGKDVVDYYRVMKPLVATDGIYKLQIREVATERSLLDHFKLIAVDHPRPTDIIVSKDGEVIEYITPYGLQNARLNTTDVTSVLANSDSVTVKTAHGDSLLLSFLLPIQKDAGINSASAGGVVMEASVPCKDCEPEPGVEKFNNVSEILTSSSITTHRLRPSAMYLPFRDVVKMNPKLRFSGEMTIDYTSIALKIPASYQTTELQLIGAVHSRQGDVTSFLGQADSVYTVLDPSEFIELRFSVTPVPNGKKRTFILVSYGQYFTVVQKPDSTSIRLDLPEENEVSDFRLSPNYPNPFNPTTKIEFQLPTDGQVKIVVFDVMGREVVRLVEQKLSKGAHTFSGDASGVASGMYFCRYFITDNSGKIIYNDVKKMLLMK